MASSSCAKEGCEHVGGIWEGWQSGPGRWVCADHYGQGWNTMTPAEQAELTWPDDAAEYLKGEGR